MLSPDFRSTPVNVEIQKRNQKEDVDNVNAGNTRDMGKATSNFFPLACRYSTPSTSSRRNHGLVLPLVSLISMT